MDEHHKLHKLFPENPIHNDEIIFFVLIIIKQYFCIHRKVWGKKFLPRFFLCRF